MRLTDLNPHWLIHGGDDVLDQDGRAIPLRKGLGVIFDCPCGCGVRAAILFANPLDGGPALEPNARSAHWDRTGETFEDLTLRPSILRNKDHGGCGWHGFVTNGNVVGAQ